MSLRLTAPFVWTAGTILPVLCIAIVSARFIVRRQQHVKLGVDDWLTLPALVRSISSLFQEPVSR